MYIPGCFSILYSGKFLTVEMNLATQVIYELQYSGLQIYILDIFVIFETSEPLENLLPYSS